MSTVFCLQGAPSGRNCPARYHAKLPTFTDARNLTANGVGRITRCARLQTTAPFVDWPRFRHGRESEGGGVRRGDAVVCLRAVDGSLRHRRGGKVALCGIPVDAPAARQVASVKGLANKPMWTLVAVVGQECGADIKPMPAPPTQSRTGWPIASISQSVARMVAVE